MEELQRSPRWRELLLETKVRLLKIRRTRKALVKFQVRKYTGAHTQSQIEQSHSVIFICKKAIKSTRAMQMNHERHIFAQF